MDEDRYHTTNFGGEEVRVRRRAHRDEYDSYTEPLRTSQRPITRALPQRERSHPPPRRRAQSQQRDTTRIPIPRIVVVCFILAACFYIIIQSNLQAQNNNTYTWMQSDSGMYWMQAVGIRQPVSINKSPEPIQSGCHKSDNPFAAMNPPSIPVDFPDKVLAAYHSPAVGTGRDLWNFGVSKCINPTMALAFFMHESTFGTKGVARYSRALGNIRYYPGGFNGRADFNQEGYRGYNMYQTGYLDWYELILRYIDGSVSGHPERTVDEIIPTYAPNVDNNCETCYIGTVKKAITTWNSGQVWVT